MLLPLIKPELDVNSTEPLYRQVGQWLRQGIASGALRPGDRLPATRELAQYLDLNRATISAAYALLEQEQLISGHVGKGSFVRSPQAQPNPSNSLELAHPGWTPAQAAESPWPAAPISFATSRPSAELFPLNAFRESCTEVLASPRAIQILQLGSPQGYNPLRQYLLEQAQATGLAGPGDDILITSGCQQALDLFQRMLVSDHARSEASCRVAIEDPVYAGIRNAFLQDGLEFIGVPVSTSGLDISSCEAILASKRPKVLVLTPSFQNPTGCTIPLAGRHALLEMARRSDCLIIENDVYSDLRYRGEGLPALKQLAPDANIVVLKSFSKAAFPGLRVGWVIGPRALIARLTEIRQWCDLHTDQLSQAVLLRFAESGRLEKHRQEICASGAAQLRAVLAGCERYLPPGTSFSRPDGGMNLWMQLPPAIDAADALKEAYRRGVSYLPGHVFAVAKPAPHALRLSFAGLTPEQIEEGLRILGRLFAEHLATGPRTPIFETETALV